MRCFARNKKASETQTNCARLLLRNAVACVVEPLEQRLQLSAPQADASFLKALTNQTATPAQLAAHGLAAVQYHGKQVYAKSGEWIAKLNLDGRNGRSSAASAVAQLGLGAKLKRTLGRAELALIELPAGVTHAQAKGRLDALGLGSYIEPNGVIYLNAVPNDPDYDELYGMQNIDAEAAWDIGTGTDGVVMGVVDTGIDYLHEDLADNMWVNPGEIPGNDIDDDGNLYVDDVYGYDFADDDGDPYDDESHGTHVAGTMAAVGNNSTGVAGVNWRAQIMSLQIFYGSIGAIDAAVEALYYVADMKDRGVNIRVTNHSWGGNFTSSALYDAIAVNRDEDILFVAAAGNSGQNNDVTLFAPASFDLDNIIAVAATDEGDELADSSTGDVIDSHYGATTVDLAAPGVAVYSTIPGDSYGLKWGTSMATPHVTGVAGLAFSLVPNASYDYVRDAIHNGVDAIPALSGLMVTGGRLNAANTLGLIDPQPVVIDGDRSGSATNDTIVARNDPTDSTLLEVLVNGTRVFLGPKAYVASLTINGLGGNDTITLQNAFTFSSTLNGGDGNDNLTGNTSADALNGGNGNDTLTGGGGNDALNGGAGSDTYVFSGSSSLGSDTVTEAANVDTDTLDFTSLSFAVNVNIGLTTSQAVASNLTLTLSDATGIENVFGTSLADTITGNSRNNQLNGNSGNDNISGGTGGDVINGGSGADTLSGQAGNDTMSGDADNDIMYGGDDQDLMYGGYGNDVINGESGNDTLVGDPSGHTGHDTLIGRDGNDLLQGMAGNDVYTFVGTNLGSDTVSGEAANSDTDTLDFTSYDSQINLNIGLTTAQTISIPDLTLTLSDATAIENVIGSAFNDNIVGNSRNNTINGNAGNDVLSGQTGADVINGNSGNDFVGGDDGNDVLSGDDGNDTAYGGAGDDLVYGGWDSDRVGGDGGNDTLVADPSGAGGTPGNDTLIGGAGNDALHGMGGSDTYVFDGSGLGSDTVSSESANVDVDTLDFSSMASGANVNIGLTTAQVVSADLTLTIQDATAIENVNGSGFVDNVTGNSRNNVINGNGGNDTISGGTGGDSINGNSGNDVISGNDGVDWIWGADGNDTISAGTGDDFVYGGWGSDSMVGEDGNDQLVGDSGGGGTGSPGNDTLVGGAGNDSLYGEGGSDTYQFGGTAGLGSDSVVEAANLDADFLDFTNMGFGVIIDIGVTYAQAVTSNLTLTLSDTTGIERVQGSGNADNITGNTRDNTLQGGAANDTIYGLGGNDFLHGEGGNDTIYGGDGNDQAYGGDGSDYMNTEGGNDTLYAIDSVADTLDGGSGTDTAFYDSGTDTLFNIP